MWSEANCLEPKWLRNVLIAQKGRGAIRNANGRFQETLFEGNPEHEWKVSLVFWNILPAPWKHAFGDLQTPSRGERGEPSALTCPARRHFLAIAVVIDRATHPRTVRRTALASCTHLRGYLKESMSSFGRELRWRCFTLSG